MKDETYQPLFVREGHAGVWRPWFAWWPVWVADLRWPYRRQKLVWWQWIVRRRFHAASWFLDGCTWWWQYAEPNPHHPGEQKHG